MNACTTGDTCADGICNPGNQQLECNDGNLCTDNSCDATDGCIYTANADSCDDDNPCTVGDFCAGESCQSGPDALDCNDSNPCTDDSCEPDSSCLHSAVADDTDCDPDGTCQGGVCIPNPPVDCYVLIQALPEAPSGVYAIDPDGKGGNDPFDVWCDMTTDGGGWTLIGQFTSNLELHIFHPHKHQIQSATDGTNLTDAPELWQDNIWGHLAFNLFTIQDRELRMRCRNSPTGNWYTRTHSNLFSNWGEGDKGGYGSNSGWGVLRWTTGRSGHWVCGSSVGPQYGGIAFCQGPGAGGSFGNHRVSVSFDPNSNYGGGTAIGCNGSGIDHGKSGQWQAEMWVR
jgi:hypothetical protein